jgi:hypothetical protein
MDTFLGAKPRISYRAFLANKAFGEMEERRIREQAQSILGPYSPHDLLRPLNYAPFDEEPPALHHLSKSAAAAVDAMANRVIAAAKSFVAKANASHESRIQQAEQMLMSHGRHLSEIARRLDLLEQNAGSGGPSGNAPR